MKKVMTMIVMVLTLAVVVNLPSVTSAKASQNKVKDVQKIRLYEYDPGH